MGTRKTARGDARNTTERAKQRTRMREEGERKARTSRESEPSSRRTGQQNANGKEGKGRLDTCSDRDKQETTRVTFDPSQCTDERQRGRQFGAHTDLPNNLACERGRCRRQLTEVATGQNALPLAISEEWQRSRHRTIQTQRHRGTARQPAARQGSRAREGTRGAARRLRGEAEELRVLAEGYDRRRTSASRSRAATHGTRQQTRAREGRWATLCRMSRAKTRKMSHRDREARNREARETAGARQTTQDSATARECAWLEIRNKRAGTIMKQTAASEPGAKGGAKVRQGPR